MIDTGSSNKCVELEKELKNAGCTPENHNLIILTQGDFGSTGNAAYLYEKFYTKITVHHGDRGMVEKGNMFWNRKNNFFIKKIAHTL